MSEDRTPILVGCGQITQREEDPALAKNAMDLMADAAHLAAADTQCGNALLESLDTIVVIRSFSDTSWRFKSPFGGPANPPQSIARRIGNTTAKRLIYTWPGGNMPQWCVNRLFEMVTRGEVQAAMICGGEALATQKAAMRAKITLDWNEESTTAPQQWGISRRGWSDIEEQHRMSGAIFAYPLFENAIRANNSIGIIAHQNKMGELFARFSAVAQGNPLADRQQRYRAADIATVSSSNPYIGFPYTRLMNANAFIDQSAALILTSVAVARKFGIPKHRWVYLHGCADAHDHWYISDRHNFHSSPAMRIVAEQTFKMANTTLDKIDGFDIYSCFPSAVQIACEEMGLAQNDPRGLTVTGGLPYFGGPGNNYVTHSIAQMMNELRDRQGTTGLITANGNYITKQSAGIYSTQPPGKPFAPVDPNSYQQQIDNDAGPAESAIANGISRAAHIETYTVMHNRTGPDFGIVYGRTSDGCRFIANTPDNDGELLLEMTRNEMCGRKGIAKSVNGKNVFIPT